MDLKNQKRMEALQLLLPMNAKINQVRCGSNESKKHQDTKKFYCSFIEKSDKAFVTEAIFKNGLKADIFVLDDFRVIEIANTEKEESLERKRAEYESLGLKMEVVRCY